MSDFTDVTRKLVAVFAADVEGYSRLMGADEVGTLKGLTERRAILDRIIGEHRGRIANTAGDSVLAEFGSAVDAVKCAVDAQTALAEANSSLPPDRRINFRMGVHIGDVMVKAGDLFGDGVNIAARLQTLAKPGAVCISGATHDQVRKVLPMTFDDLGAQQVKNIEEPIRAYQVGAQSKPRDAAPTRVAETVSELPLPDKPSIAVLPFQNMSGDPEQEYFADGMVEEIITALSRFKSLFVIARNSSFTYKSKAVDIKQVGRELGVRYVLEGSVRKAGNRVRVTGQLIEVATGTHLWADRYDGTLEDAFDLQDQVAASVVGAIAPSVSQAEMERAKRKPISSLDAYDYYLRAQAAAFQYTRHGTDEAIGLCKQAIGLDPQFAAAYARLGAAFAQRLYWKWSADPVADASQALANAEIALSLGRHDPFILALSAQALSIDPKNIQLQDSLFEEVRRLNPNELRGWMIGGTAKLLLGDHQIAIDYFQRALRLSPLDPNIFNAQSGLACAHFLLGNYKEGLKYATDALRHHPDFLVALRVAMACQTQLGNIQAAQDLWRQLVRVSPSERVSDVRTRGWIEQDVAKFQDAYRLAGMPE